MRGSQKHNSFVPGFKPLTSAEVEGVERFVFFIGYPRSGHSFIGSVLDTHPNTVMAHKYMFLRKCTTYFQSGRNLFSVSLIVFKKTVLLLKTVAGGAIKR